MGQQIAVVAKPSRTPGVLRFEANRNLTGMGHETFRAADEARGAKPAAALARSLFATGHVDAVHVYGNVITVDLRKGHSGDGLDGVVRDLYQYWKPGMEPPAFEDLVPAEEASAAPAIDAGGDPKLAAALAKVPAHLLERSRAARARLKG